MPNPRFDIGWVGTSLTNDITSRSWQQLAERACSQDKRTVTRITPWAGGSRTSKWMYTSAAWQTALAQRPDAMGFEFCMNDSSYIPGDTYWDVPLSGAFNYHFAMFEQYRAVRPDGLIILMTMWTPTDDSIPGARRTRIAAYHAQYATMVSTLMGAKVLVDNAAAFDALPLSTRQALLPDSVHTDTVETYRSHVIPNFAAAVRPFIS